MSKLLTTSQPYRQDDRRSISTENYERVMAARERSKDYWKRKASHAPKPAPEGLPATVDNPQPATPLPRACLRPSEATEDDGGGAAGAAEG